MMCIVSFSLIDMKLTKTKLPIILEQDDSFVQLSGKFSEGLLCFRFN